MMKFPILKKMVRKPTIKTKKEDEVEVERPKTPVTPESTDDVVTSPTFATVEQEDTTIWSSTFTWDMQTTSSELDAVSAMGNVWEDGNKHSVHSDITKKNGSIDDKDGFEENVWTDVQIVAGMQSFLSVPFTVPDSQTDLKPQIECVPTILKVDESIPPHQEVEKEEEEEEKEEEEVKDGHKVSNEATTAENFDFVDLGKDNFPSKELSKEFGESTNSEVKHELNNSEIIFDESFEKCEDEKSEKIILNEEKEEDDDFGAFECGEENEESNFDDFGEFKSEVTNGIGNEKSSLDADDDFGHFGDFESGEKNEIAPAPTVTEEIVNNDDNNSIPQKEVNPNMSVTNSVTEWIDVLDKIYDLPITNEHTNNERPASIEDLVYNSNVMMNAKLNWSSFIELWSDKGGVIRFSWRGSQIQKAYLESINSISMIKKADRLPGGDLFKDDTPTSLSLPLTPNKLPTHDDEAKRDVENSTETPVNNTSNASDIQSVPIESVENNDSDKQSTDLNRNSWITMSDISFLESFSSRTSSVSSTKKSQRKSDPFLEDFLNTGTASPTSPVNNSRIDSVIAKINRNSTNLSAKLGSLKSLFGGSNDILIPIKENPSSPSVKVKTPVTVNLLDDSINDTIIFNKTKEKKNRDSLTKSKDTSTFSSKLGDMTSTYPSNDLNHQSFFSSFEDEVLPKSINNNLSSSTKINDNSLNPEKLSYDTTSEFGEMVSANNDSKQDDWISSNDLSFLESFTNNSKPSSSSSRKSQQNVLFDFSEFDLNLSSNAQPQKTDTLKNNGNPISTFTMTNHNSKREKQPPSQEKTFNSNSKQLYTHSKNVSSTSISSEFGEMVSASDTKNQNLQDDWMLNASTNQDNWMSNSGLSFLETLKTSSNNNNHKSKQLFGDLDEFISPLSNNNNNNKIKKTNNQRQQQFHEFL